MFHSQKWTPCRKKHIIELDITTSRYMFLDFIENQRPYIVPYQTAGFWFHVNDEGSKSYNGSISKYAALAPVIIGEEWLKGTITLELYAVTRERLIQTGSTNYKTFDFETSQNLIWATNNRSIDSQELRNESYTWLHQGTTELTEIWHTAYDHLTKEEIPQHHKKTHTIHFPRLHHGKLYRQRDFSSKDNYNFLIPGAQGVTKVLTKDGKNGIQLYDQQENLQLESYTAPSDNMWVYTTQLTTQPLVSYPAISLAQPRYTDETGIMKFRYAIRISTKLQLLLHLQPDMDEYNGSNKFPATSSVLQGRCAYNLPQVKTVGDENAYYFCVPYNFTSHTLHKKIWCWKYYKEGEGI